jgi:hypothetical protein
MIISPRILTGAAVLIFSAAGGSSAQVTDIYNPAPPSLQGIEAYGRFQPHAPSLGDVFVCGAPEYTASNATMIVARFPAEKNYRGTVAITIDTLGNLTRVAEYRGPPIKPDMRPGMSPAEVAEAVTAAARSVRTTTITLDLIQKLLMVRNKGGGVPDTGVIVRLSDHPDFGKLDDPEERARRVLAACVRR